MISVSGLVSYHPSLKLSHHLNRCDHPHGEMAKHSTHEYLDGLFEEAYQVEDDTEPLTRDSRVVIVLEDDAAATMTVGMQYLYYWDDEMCDAVTRCVRWDCFHHIDDNLDVDKTLVAYLVEIHDIAARHIVAVSHDDDGADDIDDRIRRDMGEAIDDDHNHYILTPHSVVDTSQRRFHHLANH